MESIDIYYIACFWGAPFWVVKQLPSDDIRLDKLIKLLLKFKNNMHCQASVKSLTKTFIPCQFWKDLP
jgi:hypothetical protein